jgi:pimeloyl-ACP methyl ester carboxylesterase
MKNKLYSYNSHYYQWRFGKIFYTQQGKGQPILLIHDLNALSSDMEWNYLVKELQKNYTVYTIDLLGCGRSDKPKLTYTSYLYVQLLTDFVNNVIKGPTHVIASGHSSSFTTMACYQNPHIFNKLLFINPESIKRLVKCPRKRNQFSKILLESPLIGTLLYNTLHSKIRIKNNMDRFFYKPNIKQKYVEAIHEAAHLQGENAKYLFSSIKNLYTNINIIQGLKQINNCIYILMGEHSDTSVIEEYQNINPSIEASIITKSKAMPQIENSKELLDICYIFFN